MSRPLHVAGVFALLLHGCMLDTTRPMVRDASAGSTGSTPGTGSAMDAARTMDGADDAGAPDAGLDTGTMPGCMRDEDCPHDVENCRVGACNPETSRCGLEPAVDCVRCGSPTKVCVSGACYESGDFYAEDFEASDALPDHRWWTTPEAPWTISSLEASSGDRSAVSGLIVDGKTTELGLRLENVPPRSVIKFRRRVRSDAGDYLHFLVNGFLHPGWDGRQDWDVVEFPVRATGLVNFVWRYSKDGGGTAYDDSAWVDDISIKRECSEPGQ